MRVAVLGGGLQGCATALALADRGVDVVLFDRNEALLSRTAVANEGKIHLGYMYAADPTLATARTMMMGALAFAPFFERHLGIAVDAHATSMPAAYVVHRDSQHDVDEASAYLADVHRLISEAAEGRRGDYFGARPSRRRGDGVPPSATPASMPAAAVAVFDTPEVAINPVALAAAVRERITGHPLIEVRLGAMVRSACIDGDRVLVEWGASDGSRRESFEHAVNALWDGRLALDETMGLRPGRPWIHRLKYGVSFTLPEGVGASAERDLHLRSLRRGGQLSRPADLSDLVSLLPARLLVGSCTAGLADTPGRAAARRDRAQTPSQRYPRSCRVSAAIDPRDTARRARQGRRDRCVGRDRHLRSGRASCIGATRSA